MPLLEPFSMASLLDPNSPHPPSPSPVSPVPDLSSDPAPIPASYNVTDGSSLISKTVFLKVRFGALGNTRKVASSEVLETDADVALLRVSKTLLDSVELEAIRKSDGKMRAWLYNTCLPYDMGIMLLPIGLIEKAQARMLAYKAERQLLVDAFVNVYPALCAAAGAQLRSLYNTSDYPGVDAIRAKFVFDWQYISFGVPGQLAGISHDLYNAEQAKAAKQMQAATDEITLLMRQTLLEMVTHLQDKLTPGLDGKPRILRESAVQNLQEFLSTFNLRNVTDDQQLEEAVSKARALLGGTSATALRNSDLFREKIRSGMQSITSSLSGLVEEKAGRRFRFEE